MMRWQAFSSRLFQHGLAAVVGSVPGADANIADRNGDGMIDYWEAMAIGTVQNINSALMTPARVCIRIMRLSTA